MFDLIRTLIRPARKQSIFRTERAGASSVTRVFGGLVICLVVTGLLTSQRLVEMADRKEFGPDRDRWLAAAEFVHGIADGIGLDGPASAIDAALGRDDGPSGVVLGELRAIDSPPTTVPAAPTTTVAEPRPATIPGQTTSASTEATTTTRPSTTTAPTTVPPILGQVSINDPLRVWVGGDSLGEYVGSELLYRVADPDLSEVELDFAISTGLARPDYFDWPARLSEIMQRDDRPHVIVFMAGGNDDQDMLVDGDRAVLGTDDWRTAYRRRVATMMDIAAYPDVQMLWINLPPMRNEQRDAIAVDINDTLVAEAERRHWVDIVDIVDLFTGPSGGYEQFIDEPDGDTAQRARANDGVHITRTASRWVADLVWERIGDRWRFDDLTPPTTTPPPPDDTGD